MDEENLTEAQTELYLKRLEIDTRPAATLQGLAQLCIQHLKTIAFENLSLHYTQISPAIPSLATKDLFTKLVERKRGGYCFEMNGLFIILLRTLGFNVRNGAARVYQEVNGVPSFTGLSHRVIFVELDGQRWLADVGFGAIGPGFPLLFSSQPQPTENGVGSEQNILQLLDKDTWILKHRYNPASGEWKPVYKFTMENYQCDFYIEANEQVARGPTIFTACIIATKLIANGSQLERITLRDTKVHVSGVDKYELVETFGTETDRIAGLRQWFNIELTEQEVVGILDSKLALLTPGSAK